MADYATTGALMGQLNTASFNQPLNQPKEAGLLDQLVQIADRINAVANQLDATADRIAGPTPQAVMGGANAAGSPQMPNLAGAIRMIRDVLSRAEYEANRISGAL